MWNREDALNALQVLWKGEFIPSFILSARTHLPSGAHKPVLGEGHDGVLILDLALTGCATSEMILTSLLLFLNW